MGLKSFTTSGLLARFSILTCMILFRQINVDGQYLIPSDSLIDKRVTAITVAGGVTYGAGMYLLGNAWYKNSLTNNFRFFNDNGEWLQVDKIGHIFSAYNESRVVYQMYKWAGVSEDNSILLGLSAGLLAQTSLEIFDGFSEKWGFSWGDMSANFIGLTAFGLQQKIWHEQRIVFKISSDFRDYSRDPLIPTSGSNPDNLYNRAGDIYGRDPMSRLLKDYNAQTNWISINPASFTSHQSTWWPAWINIAAGYSAENMFGGFGNSWEKEGNYYDLDKDRYPRYRQYLLSADIDFTKISVRSPFLKTLFQMLNIFKMPAPALEYNSIQGMKWHWIFF